MFKTWLFLLKPHLQHKADLHSLSRPFTFLRKLKDAQKRHERTDELCSYFEICFCKTYFCKVDGIKL